MAGLRGCGGRHRHAGKLTRDAASEWQAQVSPDGRRLVFMSDRDLEAGDEADVFVRELAGESPREVRVTRGGGAERFRVGAGQYTRVGLASRQGLGTGTFVSELPAQSPEGGGACRATRSRGRWRTTGWAGYWARRVQPPRCQWCWRRGGRSLGLVARRTDAADCHGLDGHRRLERQPPQ